MRKRVVAFIIALAVFCVSGYFLVMNYYHEFTSNRVLDNIRQEAVVAMPVVVVDNAEYPEEDVFSTIFVDFDILQDINREIIAWIHIPNTPVSYPVLFGTDNQFYLNHTFDRRYNILGSIFIDFRNDPDFEDRNTIIYGHDTRNEAKFGSLKRFLEQAHADANRYIHIIRPGEVFVYEIFAVYETLATSDTYSISFASEEMFKKYINEMAVQTVVEAGAPPTVENIITLSTCVPNRRDMRLVIQAKLVDIHEIANIVVE